MVNSVIAARLFMLVHLVLQFFIVFKYQAFSGSEGVLKYLQLVFMATLWYTSFVRYRRNPASLQKRFINYAFLTWLIRSYVRMVSHGVADLMSLAVVWMFFRSQTHVLNLPQKSQKRIDVSFITFEILLSALSLIRTIQPGVVQNVTHTVIFTGSHLIYIALLFALYARAVVITRDPTVKVRFAFLMVAAVLYVGLFLSDFLWRYLVPGATGNTPVEIKNFFDVLGMLSLYMAFNMSDSTRSMVLLWHRVYTGQALQRLISLVLHISEAVSQEEDHILPAIARRVATRLDVSAQSQQIVRQAAAVVSIIHRHELPSMHQQWQPPSPVQCATVNNASQKRRFAPFEDRLTELEQVQVVIEALDIPYEASREKGPFETEILRVVLAYLTGTSLDALSAASGKDFAPRVVEALVDEVKVPDSTAIVHN